MSSLSWGNVPSVGASTNQRAKTLNQQKRNATTTGNNNLGTNNSKEIENFNSFQRSNNDSVEEFVLRVTNLSKQVEQYKQLSNQRAQQVAISSYNNSGSDSSFNHGDVSLRVGGNDITKKIR